MEVAGLNIKIGAENKELLDKLKQSQTELSKVKGSVSEFGDNIGILRLRYRELSRMSLVGKSAEEIKQVEAEMANLQDAIGDYDAKIKSLSLDPFQKAAEGVQAFSSVMAGAAGVVTLMGGNEEKLNKIMQQTVALIAIANAAQTAADFTKQNAIGIWLKDKTKDIALRIQEALTIKGVTAATAQETTAKGALGVVQKGLIALQNAWNAAMKASPIFLLITAIAAVTAGVIALSNALRKGKEESTALNTAIDGTRHATVEAVNAHNEHIWAMQELNDRYRVVIGSMTEYEAEVAAVKRETEKSLTAVRQEQQKAAEETSGFWRSIKDYALGGFSMYGMVARQARHIAEATAESSGKILQIKEQEAAKLKLIETQRQKKLDEDHQKEIELAKKVAEHREKYASDGIEKLEVSYKKGIERLNAISANLNPIGGNMAQDMERLRETFNQQIEAIYAGYIDISEMLSQAVEAAMENMTAAFAEGIGLLAAGEVSMGDVFRMLGEQVANFADSLGKALIAAGIASDAFRKLFAKPFLAVAAGAALVAAAAVVRAKLKAGVSGGGGASSGGGSYSAPSSAGGSIGEGNWNSRTVYAKQQALVVTGTLKASGTELVAVINNENKRRSW